MSAELVNIPFHGTELLAVEADGKPEIVLKPATDSLGLAFDSQRRKLNSRSWATVTHRVVVAADGKSREMVTVDVRTFLMLLATINENNVAEDKRPLLIAYQSEVADVIESYFRDGGAINPRATEDQLSALARRAQLQAEVIKTLKGVVDDRHLEAKGRLILARALGEAPELDAASTPLYVSDYLTGKGLPRTLVQAKASGFGKRLKALYIVKHDREPELHFQELPNGTVREARAYTEADRPLFDAVWAKHYANVVADSARGMFEDGEL
jgi:hypothetical protein